MPDPRIKSIHGALIIAIELAGKRVGIPGFTINCPVVYRVN